MGYHSPQREHKDWQEIERLRRIEQAAREAIDYYDMYLRQPKYIEGQKHGYLHEPAIECLRAALEGGV